VVSSSVLTVQRLRLLKQIASALILALIPSMLAAQPAVFRGRVFERQSGRPLAGATITIAGFPGTVRTDATGAFLWEPAPSPPFQVVIVLPGGQVARPVDIVKLEESVDLPVDALASESLTVVGAAPSLAITPAAATTLLSAEQIAHRSPEHLLQALETVPGLAHVSEGHAAVPAIRGLARGRTLLLIDGGRVSSERRVGPSATFADPESFAGIDVARGPGSVAYGSDALGGVISVRTRRAEPGSPLRMRGSVTLAAGIPERRGTIEVSRGFATGGIIVQGHARKADDWSSPEDDSRIFNSGWQDGGFLARFDRQVASGLFSVGWTSDFGRNIERPRNNSRTVRFYYPYENAHRLSGSYELPNVAGFQALTFTGFTGAHGQRTDQDRFGTATAGRTIERADVSARDFHVKGHAARSAGSARLEFGVDVNGRFGLEALDVFQTYDTNGNLLEDTTNVSIDSAHRTNVGAYFQADAAIEPTARVSGGIRADSVTTRNTAGFFGDRSTSHGAFSGFASATLGPFSGFSVTSQVSRGFRDPTLSDRYFRGPSGRGFITGNPDLEPERSLQFDVAARYAFGRTQVSAYVYQYRIDDLIERFSTEMDFFFFRNRGRARIRGIELESKTELAYGLAVELGGHISRGIALDDRADLDDISADTLSLVVRKNVSDRGFVQLRGAVHAADDRPGPTEVAAPGATIVDLAGGWKLTPRFELRGGVRNLLDDSYYASPDPRWVFAPGRSASLTLSARF
jgi:hemoglobin/transferrin/lactoferrin receptor protein